MTQLNTNPDPSGPLNQPPQPPGPPGGPQEPRWKRWLRRIRQFIVGVTIVIAIGIFCLLLIAAGALLLKAAWAGFWWAWRAIPATPGVAILG